MTFKGFFSILLLLSMMFFIGASSPSDHMALSSDIVLIPLDSRPCNTDYIIYAGGASDKKIYYPKELLDNYNTPSQSDSLYDYLYESFDFADTYIIYTNQLLNGGLIGSRNPQSYVDIQNELVKFNTFLRDAKKMEKQVIVLSVLPRVIPSQFTDLWSYKDELINYSLFYGKTEGYFNLITRNSAPKEIISKYLSLYKGSDLIINAMKEHVENDLIDLFVIGQDDTYEDSITNHQIRKYLNYNNEKIIVQPGADELTKLILARLIRRENSTSPLDLNVLYMDATSVDDTRTFESFSTKTRSDQLLSFLWITQSSESKNLAIIHNNSDSYVKTFETLYENLNQNYLSIIDIAYINKGDPTLFSDLSFIKKLNGYSGWNTIGNSLGTEYANLVIYDFLNKNLSSYPEDKQLELLENYYKLLYVHFTDDYLYQGILRNKLNEDLIKKGEDMSFINNKEAAELFLDDLFAIESQALNKALSGYYYEFGFIFHIEQGVSDISLPWKRTFEAKIIPDFKIEKR